MPGRGCSSQFKPSLCRAQLDAVAGREQLTRANRLAVDQNAVGRAQILDLPAIGAEPDLGVAPGDAGVVEPQAAIAAAPDRATRGRHQQAPAADREQRPGRAALGGFDGSSYTLGGAVDHRLAMLLRTSGPGWDRGPLGLTLTGGAG